MRWFSKWSGQESAPFWFVSKYLFIDFSGHFFWDRTDGSLSISICLGRGAATDGASICRAPAFLAVSWGNWRWDRLCSCPWGVENLMEQGRQLWISQEFTSEFIFWLQCFLYMFFSSNYIKEDIFLWKNISESQIKEIQSRTNFQASLVYLALVLTVLHLWPYDSEH